MGKKGETLTPKKPPPTGPVFPKSSMFVLDGAGDSSWNGFFHASGSQGGLKAYAHSKSKEKRLYSDASGRWVCVEGGEFFYFAPGGKGPRPPTGGWVAQRGAAPAPKLSWNPQAKSRLEDEEQEAKAKAAATRKKEREARFAAKKSETHNGRGETEHQRVARLQKQLMPLVKRGEVLEAAGENLGEALALYQRAMAGFAAEDVPRPKLKQKIDVVLEKISTGTASKQGAAAGDGENEPKHGADAIVTDHSVEIESPVDTG